MNLIKEVPGKDETEKLGSYFGRPWGKKFQAKENQYLEIEKNLMSKEYPLGSILDLTGSAIYHAFQLGSLSEKGLVICLESSEQFRHEMFKNYINDPKPVCWNGIFQKKDNETNEEALSRCYILLLEYRSKLYHEYADVIIPYRIHRNLGNADEFVEEVCKRL